MEKKWENEFWEALEKHFRTITDEVMPETSDTGEYTLHCLFTTVKGGKGIALFDAQIFTPTQDMTYFEVMVLPQFSIAAEKLQEIESVIQNMNYFMPFGALGIYYPRNELFFRYVIKLDTQCAVEKTIVEIGKLYETIGAMFGNLYEALERVATGITTYDQEAAVGGLLRK